MKIIVASTESRVDLGGVLCEPLFAMRPALRHPERAVIVRGLADSDEVSIRLIRYLGDELGEGCWRVVVLHGAHVPCGAVIEWRDEIDPLELKPHLFLHGSAAGWAIELRDRQQTLQLVGPAAAMAALPVLEKQPAIVREFIATARTELAAPPFPWSELLAFALIGSAYWAGLAVAFLNDEVPPSDSLRDAARSRLTDTAVTQRRRQAIRRYLARAGDA